MYPKNRIFVAGLPRSGTTMVQNILDSHPKIYGGPEFDRIPNIMNLRNNLHRSFDAGRIKSYTSKKAIDEAIAVLITSLFENIESDKDFEYISEKTPWNILFFDELLEVFPKAKFVMVLRNPLDVFNSMKKVAVNAKKNQVTPPDFSTHYKIAVAYMESVYRIMQRLLAQTPGSFHVIRYEDLLSDLDGETKKLCAFIGIGWTKELLDFHTIKHPGEETMIKDGVWYTKSMYNKDPNEATKKVSVLTFYEKAFIKYMFRNHTFVNPNNCYFPEFSSVDRIIGKLIYQGYKNNYRFKYIPKRVLS